MAVERENEKGFNWIDLNSLFEELNANCNYLILRNYENMSNPDFFCDGHEDIDILCENTEEFKRVAKAERMYNGDDIHLYVVINGQKVPIDLRCVGDSYYCKSWEQDMLFTRKIVNTQAGSWYVMNDEHYYYSLVYHAILQKKRISVDYLPRLQKMAEVINIHAVDAKEHIEALVLYMREKDYMFTYAEDISVPLNANLVPKDMVKGEVAAWKAGRDILHPNNSGIKLWLLWKKLSDKIKSWFDERKRVVFETAFFLGLISVLSSENLLPNLGILLNLLCLGTTAVLAEDIIRIRSRVSSLLFGGMIAFFSNIVGGIACSEVSVTFFVAQFLAMIAIRSLVSDRRGHLAICFMGLFGMMLLEPSGLVLPSMVWASSLLKKIVDDDQFYTRKFLKNFSKYFLVVVASGLSYVVFKLVIDNNVDNIFRQISLWKLQRFNDINDFLVNGISVIFFVYLILKIIKAQFPKLASRVVLIRLAVFAIMLLLGRFALYLCTGCVWTSTFPETWIAMLAMLALSEKFRERENIRVCSVIVVACFILNSAFVL